MNLVVFDIDGTLTLGDGLGTQCFFSAFDDLFAPGVADRRLHSYTESTDGGIAREAFARIRGRHPDDGELESLKAAYLDRLALEIGRRAGAYRAVPGANAMLERLSTAEGWSVAIATGNWRRAAALKLGSARVRVPAVLAGGEDGFSRREVLAAAVSAAASACGGREFRRVVYVGDQSWDLHAAREAGVGFVGVARDERRRLLEREGVVVVENHLDVDAMLAALEAAAPLSGRAPGP